MKLCPICGFGFDSDKNLARHIENKHKQRHSRCLAAGGSSEASTAPTNARAPHLGSNIAFTTIALPSGVDLIDHQTLSAVVSTKLIASGSPALVMGISEEVLSNIRLLRQSPTEEVLAMFTAVCGSVLEDKAQFSKHVRKIKNHFIQREFLAIFTDPNNLFVYLARWVPPRALCYLQLFGSNPALKRILTQNVRWTCLGAGPGSELVALSALGALHMHRSGGWENVDATAEELSPVACLSNAKSDSSPRILDVILHDIGDFCLGASKLAEMTQQRWGIGANRIRAQFLQGDLLAAILQADLAASIASSHVITLLFTVNELFQQNQDSTFRILKKLATSMHAGAFLVVADSVSDMSTITVFGGKTYRVPEILDNVFKGMTIVSREDSVWYRLPKNVNYACELQNVHYFLRCYQKPFISALELQIDTEQDRELQEAQNVPIPDDDDEDL